MTSTGMALPLALPEEFQTRNEYSIAINQVHTQLKYKLQDLVSNYDPKDEYINTVQSLLNDNNSVTERAVETALCIIKELPNSIESPDIFADSEGDIEFDWYLDNGSMFSINIGSTGEVAISGLYDMETRLTGMQWGEEDEILLLVCCGLDWLSQMQKK